jgi:hypothetical protein
MPKSEEEKKKVHWTILWQNLSAWLIQAAQNQSSGLHFGILSMDLFPPPIWLSRDKFLGLEPSWFLKRTVQASSLSVQLFLLPFWQRCYYLGQPSDHLKTPLRSWPSGIWQSVCNSFHFPKFSPEDQALLDFKDKYWAQQGHREGTGAWELGLKHLSAETDFLCSQPVPHNCWCLAHVK